MKQNPFKNVGEIHKEWTAAGVSASRTTKHRRMQDMGFSCRVPCVKPLFIHNLSKIKIDNKSNGSSLSVILKKEHCQTPMLTNNNLHIVRIGYKN